MEHSFNLPPKSRVAEGWAVAGVVLVMLAMLWLVL